MPHSGVMTEYNQTCSVADPVRPARQVAQLEIQHILLLWKTASERLALSLPATNNIELCHDSFDLAKEVFDEYREALMGAFDSICDLPDVEAVWKTGLLQYQWRSKSGNPRRLFPRDYSRLREGTSRGTGCRCGLNSCGLPVIGDGKCHQQRNNDQGE